MANLQESAPDLVKCISCHKLCNNRKYLSCRHRIRPWAPWAHNPVLKIAVPAKYGQDDRLQNVNLQVNQQDGSLTTLDVPFKDRRYCYDCFKALEHFWQDLEHEWDAYVSNVMMAFHPQQDKRPSWFDFWSKVFKSLDKFFGTDTYKSLPPHSQDNPRIAFESLAMQRNDLPVRLGAIGKFFSFCVTCNVSFENKEAIEDHIRDFHKETSNPSKPTQITFPTRDDKSAWFTDDHDPGKQQHPTWYCNWCWKLFKTQEEIDDHNVCTHRGNVRFFEGDARRTNTCQRCNRIFNAKYELECHMNNHPKPREIPLWYCSKCDIIFRTEEGIEGHNQAKHRGRVDIDTYHNVETNTCQRCNRTFSHKDELEKHHKQVCFPEEPFVVPPEGAWYCSRCDRIFRTQHAVNAHNEDVHREWRKYHYPPLARRSFSCMTCNRMFNTQHEIDEHTSDGRHDQAEPEGPWQVSLECCIYTYQTKEGLREHQRKRHPRTQFIEGPPFSCGACDRTFESQEALEAHGAKLPESMPVMHQAPVEEEHGASAMPEAPINKKHKTSPTPEVSINHHREAPSTLRVPIKQEFEIAAVLEDTPEPPFSCAICNRTFNSQNAIDNHNKDKHKVLPVRTPVIVPISAVTAFTCLVCKAMFKSINAVEHHCVDLHDGLTAIAAAAAFSCDTCGKMFRTKKAAICHNKDTHAPRNPLKAAAFRATMREAIAVDNLTCYPCDRVFSTMKALWMHQNNMHNPQVCHCNERFPGWKSFREHKQVCLPDQTVTLKQESVCDSTVDSYSEQSSERSDRTESHLGDYSDGSEDGSEDDPEVNPNDDPEDDSEGELEDGSECESEDDSEDESVDESEDDMEQDVEDDASESEEDYGSPKWPEYGQVARIPCLYRHVGCGKVFSTASMLMQHHELHSCPVDIIWFDSDIFDDSAWSRKVYDDINDNYKCPYCKSKDGGRFDFLFQLLHHAESNECNLRVRTGPIKEIRSKLLEFADNVR